MLSEFRRVAAGVPVALVFLLQGCGSAEPEIAPVASAGEGPAIHFSYQPSGFIHDNAETDRKYQPETMSGGVAVLDANGDGHADIYLTNGAQLPELKKTSESHYNRLLLNDGGGRFSDATEGSGLEGTGYDTGVAVGDYDGDGDTDVFLAGVLRNTLYRNDGGVFTDVTAASGLGRDDPEFGPLWAVGAAWLDYDNDSRLDLFVVNYLYWRAETERACADYCHPKLYDPTPNRLWRNNGDGTFTDVSEAAGIRQHLGKGMGAGVADFDRDGFVDIFVTNDKEFNFLFVNQGDGTFVESAFESGVALIEDGTFISGMGVDARDVNNDGLPDIAFVALPKETFPLFINSGGGQFEEITWDSGLMKHSSGMAGYSPTLVDFDNDGWKDLLVSRGHVVSVSKPGGDSIPQPNTVFRNLGGGEFVPMTGEAGFDAATPKRHRGSAFGDFNHDGRIDAVVLALDDEAEIWMNDSPAKNHWLGLELRGTVSNRGGIGAEVKVVSAGLTQYNAATTAVGYASSSDGPVHFGLGADAVAERIEIRWPSGTVQVLEGVEADQIIRVVEGAGQ